MNQTSDRAASSIALFRSLRSTALPCHLLVAVWLANVSPMSMSMSTLLRRAAVLLLLPHRAAAIVLQVF
jgi:hypothetical protein